MDRTTFKEHILADDIQRWERMGKKELLDVLIKQRWDEFEKMSDDDLFGQVRSGKNY